jgi:hypothetical protein
MYLCKRSHLALFLFTSSWLLGCNSDETSSDATADVGTMSRFLVVDTGQSECSDEDGAVITCGSAYDGQDAQFDGQQMSYTDNGNSTVTDNVTTLMWQQTPSSENMSYEDAVSYCNSLSLGGYSDWRIPTTKELFSISDFSTGWPYLNTTYFDIAGDSVSKDEQFWTELYVGNTVEGGDDAAFGINHGTGHIKAYAANVSGQMGNYVRAVRGDYYGVNDFTDNGDDTITDSASGLMWEKNDSGYGMEWADALTYAENATTAGYSDWRLPNIKELQSIVDYTHSPSASDTDDLGPAIDTDYFNITSLDEDSTISYSTSYSPDYGYFWSSTSAYWNTSDTSYYFAWYVAFGTAVDDNGDDYHGAGAVRYDTKYDGGADGEDGERYYNYVRLVRDVD